jgi:uncharacterized protein YjbI with pentapeptide repeats
MAKAKRTTEPAAKKRAAKKATPKTVTVKIKNRFTGALIFDAKVDASLDKGRRIGAAVLLAIKARANLADAYLADAYLADANLADAYLAGANLARANLARANLADANLADANLADANLADAYLVGANLAGAKCLFDIGLPDGYRFAAVKHDGCVMIAVGCRWFTFGAAVAHWKDRPDRAKSRAALKYLRALCAVEGWQLGKEA